MQQPDIMFNLSQLKAICYAIAGYEDLNLLIQHLAEGATRTFKAKGCSIMLLDEGENQLFTVGSFGLSDEYQLKGPVFAEDKDKAFIKGEPVYIDDMQTFPGIQYPEAAKAEGIVSMLSIPIKYRGAVQGVIRIYQDVSRRFHPEDIDSLKLLGVNLGLVIENNGLKNFVEQVKIAMENLPSRIIGE